MSTLVLPGPPPQVPALEPRSSGAHLAGPVRRAAETCGEASDWADGGGMPPGWEGEAASSADHAMTRLAGELDATVAVLHRVAGALDDFFGRVAALETRRDVLVDDRDGLSARQQSLAADGASYTEDEEAGLRERATTLQVDIDNFVGRIEAWQRDTMQAEDDLVAVLEGSDSLSEAEQYVASRSSSLDALVDDLVDDGTLPPGAADMTSEELRDWLVEHPEAAAALMQRTPQPYDQGPAGELGSLLQPAFVAEGQAGAFEEQRRADLRALFEGLPAEDAALLAMLYPTAVGNRDGVPFENRADANTVAVVDALARQQGDLADMREQHEHNQGDWDFLGRNNDDLEGPIEDAESRIALYESILSGDRQILYFDPSGDGAIAELHGDIGAETRNVGVSVPGTGTDLAGYQGVADRSESFVNASPPGELAMISWMGGDLPDSVVQDAPFANYARDLGPQLADFSHDVRQEIDHSAAAGNDAQTTYLGHSYGGAVVGRSELAGLDADRVLHVESAGMGHDVQDPGDLPASQAGVDRYSMTAPGDIIELSQGTQAGDNIGHGADPDSFPGTVRLDTGNTADGEFNTGKDSHSAVFEEQSDAWYNMVEVLNGGEVTTYRAPEYDYVTSPYGGVSSYQTGWGPGEQVDIE